MTARSLERLRQEGEAFMQELSREHYEASAGLKQEAAFQPIYDRYRQVLDDEAFELVLEAFRAAPAGSEAARSAGLLLEWQVESQAARQLASLDEQQIAWENTAILRLADGRELPYQRAMIEMANAADREERLRIETARAALVTRELAPLRQERFERERDIVLGLDLAADYNSTFEILSGISLTELVGQCEQFLRDTQPMWDEVFPTMVRRTLGLEPGEATRADALALLRAREFDAGFPRDMESVVRGQVREMGIDPDAAGRIHFDTVEREGKRSRAFCAPVRIPDEIHLVLRPHGGQADWTTLLHELGHALHFAYMRRDLPFEFRWLGDNSITEAYAMLFDHLMQDRGWLLRYSQLGRARVDEFRRMAGFEELHFLRRYSAKLIYEVQLYAGDVAWRALPDLYVETLSGATSFRYDRADAFVDVDPRYYAARYLRAWQLQALLAESLVERFDEDWYRNPQCGPWMVGALFGEGQRERAAEQAERVARRDLSFAPLVRSIERLLGA